MTEPMGCARCCALSGIYCDRCDLLVGLPGLHVIKVVVIELHRRIARGFQNRENYRLRMLLIGSGLTSPHLK